MTKTPHLSWELFPTLPNLKIIYGCLSISHPDFGARQPLGNCWLDFLEQAYAWRFGAPRRFGEALFHATQPARNSTNTTIWFGNHRAFQHLRLAPSVD